MNDPYPGREKRELVVASTSRAADGGYFALADLAQIAAVMNASYRIVGGHMVTLLAAAHGVANSSRTSSGTFRIVIATFRRVLLPDARRPDSLP